VSDARQPLPVERFDYDLPPELIAQAPADPRDSSRLLVVDRVGGHLRDHTFYELPALLRPGDVLVVNDTRVMAARLLARRATGGRVELLLLSQGNDGLWTALARPARRLRPGEQLSLIDRDGATGDARVQIIGRQDDTVSVAIADPAIVERYGRVPLPPYITSSIDDPERYQTVYAREMGSAAAPTAGLHFTPRVLERLRERDVELRTVTLHVGLDTFQPIKSADALDHAMHAEWYHVSGETAAALAAAKRAGRRVVAVGTTSVRTLETLGAGGTVEPREHAGWTKLYITPGCQFRVVDAMLTNFHLPRTTLLLLVSAFAGDELIRRAYQHAIWERYRFYSFGDAMLIV
jgi:S-adenosylmethionine:tRNA ribosyltransferase-isomerase